MIGQSTCYAEPLLHSAGKLSHRPVQHAVHTQHGSRSAFQIRFHLLPASPVPQKQVIPYSQFLHKRILLRHISRLLREYPRMARRFPAVV